MIRSDVISYDVHKILNAARILCNVERRKSKFIINIVQIFMKLM